MKTLSDLTDENLVSRAIGSARHPRKVGRQPRHICVAIAFGLTAPDARKLCEEYGYDPEERVRR